MIQATSLFSQLLQHFRAEFEARVRKHDAERGALRGSPSGGKWWLYFCAGWCL
jgi:hypothetical protein